MAVSYIGQSTRAPITGTSTTITVPASTAVGDLVLLYVFHRSDLTLPAGFTLVDNITFYFSSLPRQDLSIYQLSAVSGDISRVVTVAQASNERLGAIINVFRGSITTPVIVDINSSVGNDVNPNPTTIAIPTASSSSIDQVAVALLSIILTSSDSDYTQPSGFTKSYSTGVSDKRLFSAYKAVSIPDVVNGNFTRSSQTGRQGYGTYTLIISDTGNEPTVVGVRATQAPLLVIDTSPKASRITQAPVLVLSVPAYPVRVTQAPVLTPFIPKPFPKPKLFVPEVPVTEIIEWNTSIASALNGNEQRNLLRDVPRRLLQFSILAEDHTTRQGIYRLLVKYLKEQVLYPLYHYYEKVSTSSSAGSSRIDFDTRYIDVFAGEQLAVYDPQYEQTYFVGIDTVDVDGVTTTEPLEFDIQSHFIVSSTSSFTVDASATLQMDPVHGVLSMGMISTRKGLLTPQNTSSVETYQGLPILPFRPNTPATEGFTYKARFTDNGVGPIKIFSDVNFLVMEGPRSFIINRKEDLNKLRKFADLIKGSQKPFYLPTYYDDLSVIERPVNGSNMVKVSNLAYHDLSKTEAWRTLRFETAAGVKYRKVNDSRVVYDSNGQALSLELYLNASLGPNNNDNSVSKVSFMPRVRLTDDRITLTHNEIDTRVEITVTVVKQ